MKITNLCVECWCLCVLVLVVWAMVRLCRNVKPHSALGLGIGDMIKDIVMFCLLSHDRGILLLYAPGVDAMFRWLYG